MAESYVYSSDGQARLVLAGWLVNPVVYGYVGGKIYAERWAKRGGFIGLFQTHGWVSADADSVGVTVTFQGLLPGVAPLLQQQSAGGPNRHDAEVSYWAVGMVKINFGSGGLGLPTASVEVRGLQVEGRGVINGEQLKCPPVKVGSFID